MFVRGVHSVRLSNRFPRPPVGLTYKGLISDRYRNGIFQSYRDIRRIGVLGCGSGVLPAGPNGLFFISFHRVNSIRVSVSHASNVGNKGAIRRNDLTKAKYSRSSCGFSLLGKGTGILGYFYGVPTVSMVFLSVVRFRGFFRYCRL